MFVSLSYVFMYKNPPLNELEVFLVLLLRIDQFLLTFYRRWGKQLSNFRFLNRDSAYIFIPPSISKISNVNSKNRP